MARLWLMALALVAWGLVPLGAFQYDDFPNILLEPSTTDLTRASGLRFLLRASYFADHTLWGMNARGFLLTNLLLHLASVLCVFELARAPLPGARTPEMPRGAAFLAAALFAVQPAHAGVVAYASGRSAGLASALLLGGLVLRARGRPRAGLAAFALACLAKETALVFPLLVWLRERDARRLARLAVPALALAAALLAVPRYRELAAWSLAERAPLASLAVGVAALPVQLSLWARPWALSVEHAFPVPPASAAVLAGAALVAALLGAAWATRRRAPLVAFAIAWAAICLAPTSTWIARADPIHERALYLAWVGPAIALGHALARLRLRGPRLGAVVAVTLLAWGVGFSAARVRVWADERALWADAVEKAPASARAWNNLGMAYLAHDELRPAADAFRRALAIDPRHPRALENLRQLRVQCGEECP